ncbi:probable Histone-lysine N-methyltransferase ATXR5 isoform X1 [Dendrobium catenatum]|uniref:[histone H3]-lysine(27) N-methyltransferase n=1 Tax=Dendrobium catenatum TaxID=906689 RepID=A0A2I0W3S5_9ASPA|nr:probable Histone-lysine N-methyltransferase ATXR5 isoform X1 [Dendrobium catenatum]XP_028554442.1 probable Histone-lysine N-methyltransferase ATXR5 isoform X1 [Dendrobium catenatum]PKU70303.1 Histone-lysine N-methyltransferase ATXR6 [Dendrobium catenatum]
MLREEDVIFRSNGSVRKRTKAPPPESGKKYRPMGDIMRTAKPVCPVNEDYYSYIRCEQCRSGEREDELVLCDRCDMGYHLYCLRPIAVRVPVGPWFCPSCTGGRTVRRFPQLQKMIVDFFRIQQLTNAPEDEELRAFHSEVRKRRRRSMPLVRHKKMRRILPFTPSKDPKQRLEQMCSLATALTALQMEFCNDLTYMPGMAPRSANKAIYEKGGMQLLAKKDKETLEICRTMYRRGECPPLVVVFDACEGFTVQADKDIKDMTFITEYTGDVDYLEKREDDDCDSMMTLLLATKTSQSLVVCPDKRGNIACFISGINNYTLEGRKKQNLKCVRYNVDGECRVLLVACRDITRGERLYYDYNGYEQEYPTEHFF